MKVVKETYVCDICGKEFSSSDRLKKVSVPCAICCKNEWGTPSDLKYENMELELCDSCLKGITKVKITSRFYDPNLDIELI